MRKLPHTAAEGLLEIVMRRYERASTLLLKRSFCRDHRMPSSSSRTGCNTSGVMGPSFSLPMGVQLPELSPFSVRQEAIELRPGLRKLQWLLEPQPGGSLRAAMIKNPSGTRLVASITSLMSRYSDHVRTR
jgi:hypothetical protein